MNIPADILVRNEFLWSCRDANVGRSARAFVRRRVIGACAAVLDRNTVHFRMVQTFFIF